MKLPEFQHYLKIQKIGLAFLVHPDINITYFTQTKPSFAFLVVTPKTAELYLTALDAKPKLKNIQIKALKKSWKKKIQNKRIMKLGVNKESLTVAYQEKLKKLFPKAKMVDLSPKLQELRAQKTAEEVKRIKKACQIMDLAFSQLLTELPKKKLKTEKQVAEFMEQKIKEKNAEIAFPTLIALGRNASVPHHQTSDTKLERGFLLLDFGASYQNYASDMSRTIFLGKPTQRERERYQQLLQVQKNALKEIQENRLFSELEAFTRKSFGKYSSHFIHSLGHGLGLEVHESPHFYPEAKDKVQKNQVFTIEPGIYFPRKFGIRIEDTILFDGKVKVLTHSKKELTAIKY